MQCHGDKALKKTGADKAIQSTVLRQELIVLATLVWDDSDDEAFTLVFTLKANNNWFNYYYY